MDLTTENLQGFRNIKGLSSPQYLPHIAFSGEGGMNVRVGEMRPTDQEIQRDQEVGKETTYSNSPRYQSNTFHPTSNSLTSFPLKLQSKKHCRCDIIFPDNWTL